MKTFALCVAILAAVELSAGAQSPLDRPGEKAVTVSSEISRGRTELASALSRPSQAAGILAYMINMGEAVSKNQSRRTDSDGFMLGARFNQWFVLDFALHRDKGLLQYSSASDTADAEKSSHTYFADMRALQKKVGVDDDALFQALGTIEAKKIPAIKERFAVYDSASK